MADERVEAIAIYPSPFYRALGYKLLKEGVDDSVGAKFT